VGTQLPPRKGAQQPTPTFAIYGHRQACVRISRSPCLLWPNGWMHQDATWYGRRPRTRWEPSSPHPHGKVHSSPQFSSHVYCGQTVGWIRIPLRTEVGLDPGNIVLDGDPAPPWKGTQQPPTFVVYRRRHLCVHINHGPCLLWPNGWMDEDTTWYGGRPWLRRHCVRWELSSPLHGKGYSSPHFPAYFALA